MILIALVVIAFLLFVFKNVSFADTNASGGDGLSVVDKGNIIVYGSKTCPWCVKQEKYLIDRGIPHTFTDCTSESCPDFVSGFPTLLVNNQVKVGFTEV